MRRIVPLLLLLAVFSRVGALVPTPKPDPTDRRIDLEQLQGEWELVQSEDQRGPDTFPPGSYFRIVFAANNLKMRSQVKEWSNSEVYRAECTLYAKKVPKQYKWNFLWYRAQKNGQVEAGIFPSGSFVQAGLYRLEGDTLTLCMGNPGSECPTDFDISKSDLGGISLMVFKRSQ